MVGPIIAEYLWLVRCTSVLTVAEPEHHAALVRRAEVHRLRGELDHDEPPDGEAEGEPDGDCVDHYAEVDMELEEDRPAQGELNIRIMEVDCLTVDFTLTVSDAIATLQITDQ